MAWLSYIGATIKNREWSLWVNHKCHFKVSSLFVLLRCRIISSKPQFYHMGTRLKIIFIFLIWILKINIWFFGTLKSCTIQSLLVRDRTGILDDVVTGFDNIAGTYYIFIYSHRIYNILFNPRAADKIN